MWKCVQEVTTNRSRCSELCAVSGANSWKKSSSRRVKKSPSLPVVRVCCGAHAGHSRYRLRAGFFESFSSGKFLVSRRKTEEMEMRRTLLLALTAFFSCCALYERIKFTRRTLIWKPSVDPRRFFCFFFQNERVIIVELWFLDSMKYE